MNQPKRRGVLAEGIQTALREYRSAKWRQRELTVPFVDHVAGGRPMPYGRDHVLPHAEAYDCHIVRKWVLRTLLLSRACICRRTRQEFDSLLEPQLAQGKSFVPREQRAEVFREQESPHNSPTGGFNQPPTWRTGSFHQSAAFYR